MREELKQQIRDQLIRNDGKLNSAVIRREKFKDSNLHEEILKATNFLPKDSTISERIFCILHDITSTPSCSICGDRAFFSKSFNKGYSPTCNKRSCITKFTSEKRIETNMRKYGAKVSPNVVKAAKKRANELNRKGRETLQKKYGVSNPGELPGHYDKIVATLERRYGVNSLHQLPSMIEIVEQRRLEKFRAVAPKTIEIRSVSKRVNDSRQLFDVNFHCSQCDEIETLKGETFLWRCQHLSTPCSQCSGVLTNSSAGQLEVEQFIRSLGIDGIITNDRSMIAPLGLDIFIPSQSIAIEYDGLFWHSSQKDDKENKRRHVVKTDLCESKGIHLIHILENQWLCQQEIVKSRLRALFQRDIERIYGRQCSIVQLSPKEYNDFFAKTHLQGTTGAKVAYGLIHNDELVAAMSFGTPRFNKRAEWELLRFSTKLNTTVVGGASKLFKHFIKAQQPTSVVSYADRRWSTNSPLYKTLGFQFVENSRPNYYYFRSADGMILHSRVKFQKHKLHVMLENFDPSISEWENMKNNGYRRIWDCGNSVWMWSNSG